MPLSGYFSSAEDGAWWDVDTSTLFQDTGGTTPVASDGDPIGRWEDKSGNGYHLLQSDADKKPIYRNVGSEEWVEFDGIDDFMLVLMTNITQPLCLAVAVRTMDHAGDVFRFAVHGHNSVPGSELMDIRQDSQSRRFFIENNIDTASDSLPYNKDAHLIINANTTSSPIHVNGSLEQTSDIGTDSFTGITVGSHLNESLFWKGRIYNITVVDRNLTSPEITDYNNHVATLFPTQEATAPTFTVDGTLTPANQADTSLDIQFDKAQDETSAQANIKYRLFRAGSGTDISTLALMDDAITAGTAQEVADAYDVTSLSDSGLTEGTTYEYVVTAEDEAGNRLIYTQTQATTTSTAGTIAGTITSSGEQTQNAKVAICTSTGPLLADLTVVEVASTDINGDYSMSTAYDNTKDYVAFPIYFRDDYSGVATSGNTSLLADSGQNFTVSGFSSEQYIVRLVSGTGSGQTRIISDNTATEITVKHPWATVPDGTSNYEIGKLYSSPVNFHPGTSGS